MMGWYRRLFGSAYLFLTTAPVFILFSAHFMPERPMWMLLLFAAGGIVTAYGAQEAGRSIRARILISAAVLIALATGSWYAFENVFAVLLIVGLFVRSWFVAPSVEAASGPLQTVLGVLLYVLPFALGKFADGIMVSEAWQRVLGVMGGFVIPTLIMMLVALNHGTLLDEIRGGRRQFQRPKSMYLPNLGMLAGIAGVILAINYREAFANAIRNTFIAFINWIIRTMNAVGDGAQEEIEEIVEEVRPVIPEDILPMGLIRVLFALFILVVIVVAVMLLFVAIREMAAAFGRMFHRHSNKADEQPAYEEEQQKLWNINDALENARRRLVIKPGRRRRPEVPWAKLSAREKIRHVYKKYMVRQKEKGRQLACQTVQEVLLEDEKISNDLAHTFAKAYDKARYSNEEITQEDVKTAASLRR